MMILTYLLKASLSATAMIAKNVQLQNNKFNKTPGTNIYNSYNLVKQISVFYLSMGMILASGNVQESLWKNRVFTKSFVSYSISSFWDWFDMIALMIMFLHSLTAIFNIWWMRRLGPCFAKWNRIVLSCSDT